MMGMNSEMSWDPGHGLWPPRAWVQRAFTRGIHRWAESLDVADLGGTALVFSPHQDDETLGCGGTILRMTDGGVRVVVVYMTDGRQSHSHRMDGDVLAALREEEARDACRILGVNAGDVHFLRHVDGQLEAHREAAVAQVLFWLEEVRPTRVLVPYQGEPPADHRVTFEIVRDALLRGGGLEVDVWEYPVWFWHHWPWVGLRQRRPPGSRPVLRNTRRTRLGVRLLTDFRWAVDVRGVLERKRTALEAHRSQMSRLEANSRWPTLHDVAEGAFLACFFQPYEVFRCGRHTPSQTGSPSSESAT